MSSIKRRIKPSLHVSKNKEKDMKIQNRIFQYSILMFLSVHNFNVVLKAEVEKSVFE